MARVAAISAGPRSASPRRSRGFRFLGFFGFLGHRRLWYQPRRHAATGCFFTSPRLRGEVEIRAQLEFRVRGYRSINWHRRLSIESLTPPSPREERGGGA